MKIKVNFKSLMLLACFTALSGFAFAQKTISGLVTDGETKEPLVGAAVVVTGTTKGTLTDVDGKYTLTDIPANTTTLTFSFTGYSNLTVPIGSSNVLDAQLKGGTILESVVVVGYGTLKSKEVTSSIATIKKEDFIQGNVSDPIQLIQGKVAGLNIARPGGNPNAGFDIRLRGVSTIGANVQPLIVVDGIPDMDLSLIDPNDIESVDVLKDGSAAAIYGASASSGVILITTKKGSSGKQEVAYNANLSTSQISKTAPILSAADYKALGGTDQKATTDWYKEVTRNALSNQHNLSLGGGVGKTSYRISLNYRNNQGVLLNDGNNQLSGRFNLSQKALNDKLTLTVLGSATNKDATFGFGEAFRYATTHNPTAPILDASKTGAETGGYYQISGFDDYNPVAIVNQSTDKGKFKNLNIAGKADFQIMDGLTLSSMYSIIRSSGMRSQYYSRLGRFRGIDRNGLATSNTGDIDQNYGNVTLNYVKGFGKLDFNGVVGYDYRERTFQGFGVSAGDFPTDVLGVNSIGSSKNLSTANPNVSIGSGKSNRKLAAFFGRAGFNFDDTYFGQVTVRREGSTMFGPNNKWGVFPAVSAGVALNRALNLTAFDQLKLRIGYGVTGALPPGEYLSQTTYSAGTNGALNAVRNGNPDLKWEQKAETNMVLTS
jgi:TonB-dependent starch-binding outer membrane protein SusC